ncbi:MAG TPA: hypothetical protein VE443_14045 [Beijerinckiaceae bacterium]|nr:hypothetical protein [Microvirga sp.]HZB39106.1 hypothetical protein [Beijerinckiaceae bacterium]
MSTAGLIGAAIGLILGWLDYRIVGGLIEGKLRATDRSETPAEKAEYERRVEWFRRLFFVATVCVFPVVGYFVGRAIAG